MDVLLEDENARKIAEAVHVNQIRVSGLAIGRPLWDFCSKNNSRGITLGTRSVW